MFTLLRHLNLRVVAVESPSFLFSLLIAELFFKFHSFTLECLCFLAVWGALSAVVHRFVRP